MTTYSLKPISDHCDRLAQVLYSVCQSKETFRTTTTKAGESLNWSHAAALLKLAGSLISIELDTARFDDSVVWCETASDYHRAHSELLALLVREISLFNFIWGAFETTAKIIKPPYIPKSSSLIDAACNYLKNQYDSKSKIQYYEEAVFDLRDILSKDINYGVTPVDFKLNNYVGFSSVGLHIVRKIRNKFAHGILNIPEPEGWVGQSPSEVALFNASSRIILLTIQMLLISYFDQQKPKITWYRDESWYNENDEYLEADDPFVELEIEHLIRIIHMNFKYPPQNQIPLPL